MERRILVTGATGFIGSVLARQLVEAGETVRIFRRSTSRLDLLEREGVADAVEHALGSLGDALSLRRAMADVDRVYHAAALVGPGRRASRGELYRTNAGGTANVVNAALDAGVRRLVLTSSIAALPPPEGGPGAKSSERRPSDGPSGGPKAAVVDETASWSHAAQTPSAYGLSKRDAEREMHRGIAEGLDAVVVNPALVFGRGRAGEGTRRLVDLARKGRLVAAPPGSTCVADVEDVADGHRRAMQLGETGERYLLGGENLLWHDLFAVLSGAFGHAPPRFTLPPALLKTAGAVAEALSFVLRTGPAFSRTSADSLTARHRYANRRARRELGCTFRPFAETAHRLAETLP